jgi:hypothetical protein
MTAHRDKNFVPLRGFKPASHSTSSAQRNTSANSSALGFGITILFIAASIADVTEPCYLPQDMKNANALARERRPEGPCQRSGCLNYGTLRKERLRRMTDRRRTIFLCDSCYESLQVYQLNDLFLRLSVD